MKNYIDFEKLEKLSKSDLSVELYQKVLKVSEESGELSQAFLAYDGAKNTSASGGDRIDDVIEETCDVTNVVLDILNYIALKHPEKEQLIKDTFARKLNKWESKVEKYSK
mgnify:CR=1 FL=1